MHLGLGAVLCTGECLVASLALKMPGESPPQPHGNHQKCQQAWPPVSWVAKSPELGSLWFQWHSRLGRHTPRREEGPQQEAGLAGHCPAQWVLPGALQEIIQPQHTARPRWLEQHGWKLGHWFHPFYRMTHPSHVVIHGHTRVRALSFWILCGSFSEHSSSGVKEPIFAEKEIGLDLPTQALPAPTHTQNPGPTDMLFLETGSNITSSRFARRKTAPKAAIPKERGSSMSQTSNQ